MNGPSCITVMMIRVGVSVDDDDVNGENPTYENTTQRKPKLDEITLGFRHPSDFANKCFRYKGFSSNNL